MDPVTKFMLNSFSSILNHVTSEPDVNDIHYMIDRLATGPAEQNDTNCLSEKYSQTSTTQ